MCFHYSLKNKSRKKQVTVEVLFSQQEMTFDSKIHVNGFANPVMPVITNSNSEQISFFSWGLIPSWTKSTSDAQKIRQMTLNAKSETIFEKPSFRNNIQSKRCLIPATGFFEWHTCNNKKYPFYISLKNDEVFMFAGVWDSWTDKQSGTILNTYSIITTEANELMAKIHNEKHRMPLILSSENEVLWLSKDLKNNDILALMKPFSAFEMKAHPISRQISSKQTNMPDEELLNPFSYPELEF